MIKMRMDKFLKAVRLVKRRSVAKALCDAQRITLNGRIARAASEVHVGDVLEIRWGERMVKAKVLKLPERDVPKGLQSEYVDVTSWRLTLEDFEDVEPPANE